MMSIYAMGLLNAGVLPNQVFFEPTQKFCEWVEKQVGRVIDCGCGVGLLTSMYPDVVCGVDLYEREMPLGDVIYGICATEFPFVVEDTALVARPDHSGWHYDVFKNALREGCVVVYVGLERNHDRDLDGVEKELILDNAGKDGERAWRIQSVNR